MRPVIVIALLGLAVGFAGAKEWYETAAFYQIYPQSFKDGGDVATPKGFGTFKGIEEKLDYFKELGIDCLWLTPMFESTFNAYGYDITNYEAIDPRYGTLNDFKRLIDEVHKKEMKIIVDFVPNHCGVENELFVKSSQKLDGKDDWFVWTDKTHYVDVDDGDKLKPSNWQRIGGGPGSAWNLFTTEVDAPRKDFFYYAQFSGNMPDFNLRNEGVKTYLKGVMEFWLGHGIDGFRIDAISHGFEKEADETTGLFANEDVNPGVEDKTDFGYLKHTLTQDQPELFDLIYEWRKFLNDYQETKKGEARIMMTESYSPPDIIKQYYLSKDGAKDGAHLPFNFQMINTMKNESEAASIVKMVNDWFAIVPKGKVTNWVIGNHDQPRAASRFGTNRVDILNTLVTMLPGTSVTYYGEEIGMTDSCAEFSYDAEHKREYPAKSCDASKAEKWGDTWTRSPMQWDDTTNGGFTADPEPWIPIGNHYKTVNVKAQEGQPKSHLEIHRSLLQLRKNKAITDSDKFEMKTLNTNSFAFKRELDDKKAKSILVLINFGNQTEKVDIKKTLSGMPDLMTVEITGGISAYKKGDQIRINEEFELKQFESIVAFYNSSSTHLVSKIALLIILVCVFVNMKF